MGGLRAKKLLLFSPLLKWYIEHGLIVSPVYEVIEFSKQSCFSGFVDFVANARREGDKDKRKKVIDTLCKLIGNSSFGSCIIDPERFMNIKYVENLVLTQMTGTSVVFSLLEGEMSRIWYRNDQ